MAGEPAFFLKFSYTLCLRRFQQGNGQGASARGACDATLRWFIVGLYQEVNTHIILATPSGR